MYPNLTGLGIHEPKQIERYSLRQEAHKDILKIYFVSRKANCSRKALSLNTHDRSKVCLLVVATINTKK